MKRFLQFAFLLVAPIALAANVSQLVSTDAKGRLAYHPTELGDTIPDFSNCGYGGGGVKIPDLPVKATLAPVKDGGDDTKRIQAAINELSQLKPGADGFRGALLLTRGCYKIEGQLKITASGVVLRGEGDAENGTVLIATGKSKRNLIDIGGAGRPSGSEDADSASAADSKRGKGEVRITDDRVPVGARSFHVEDAAGFRVGATVHVSRNGNADWIHTIGMDQIKPINAERKLVQWTPFTLQFDRVITVIEGKQITVDAPIACAIEQRWGGGSLANFRDDRIEQVGVEQLYAESEFDPSTKGTQGGQPYAADEEHAVQLLAFGKVRNAWARRLTAVHFYHGVATMSGGCKWVTVEDCRSLDPVSQITGGRRYPFGISGQLCLVQRCFSRAGRHAFVFGARVCGPNVFLDCQSEKDYASSEPHHRWSVGGLYDNVSGQIQLVDRGAMGSGHGWAGANYVAWNCRGSLACEQPPTAQNYAIGFVGKKQEGPYHRKEGYWESLDHPVDPVSLYRKQLEDRLGAAALQNIGPR